MDQSRTIIRIGPRGGRIIRQFVGPGGTERFEYARPSGGGSAGRSRTAAPPGEPRRLRLRPSSSQGTPTAAAGRNARRIATSPGAAGVDVPVLLQQFATAAAPHGYQLGTITAPRGAPIAVLMLRPGEGAGRRVLVAAGVHGDDQTGPQVLLALFRGVEPGKLPGRTTFLPVVNAAGLAAGRSAGRGGGDPNRGNIQGPVSAEGETIRAHLDTLGRAARDGWLSLHEDGDAGRPYVQTWEAGERPCLRTTRVLGAMALLGGLHTGRTRYRQRVDAGIVLRGKPEGSLEELFYRRGASVAIAVEAPGRAPVKQRVGMGLAALRAFLG